MRRIVRGSMLIRVILVVAVLSLVMPMLGFHGTQEAIAGEVLCDIVGSSRANSLGFDGTGILIGEVGTGLDTGDNATLFTDFGNRVDYWIDWTEGDAGDGIAEDGFGMSTPFISWMIGDGSSGTTDPVDGKLYGMGVAPNANMIVEKVFSDSAAWFGGDITDVFVNAGKSGTFALTNSWGGGTDNEYEANANKIDTSTRDADPDTPGDQQLLLTMAAGNNNLMGSACNKNGLTMGVSEGYKPHKSSGADNIDELWTFSAQGPTGDGRIKPDIVAPATWGAGVQSHAPGTTWAGYNEIIDADFLYASGTGGAAAIACGAVALFAQYYQGLSGTLPSPALTKAALINGATDMDDAYNTGPIPNGQEGWGRLNLTNVILPAFDVFHEDQGVYLEDGMNMTYEDFFVSDSSQPFKISIVWTDVPAPDSTGLGRALINDLDLIVRSPSGTEYHGNQFTNGWSDPGIVDYDDLNNVENVYLQNPELGQWTIIVNAKDIQQDALIGTAEIDQDYAMVVSGLFVIGGGPVVTSAYADPNPTNGAAVTTLYATFTDSNNITDAEYFIDAPGPNGTGISMQPMDGLFDSPDEDAFDVIDINVQGWLPGETHTLYVHGLDEDSLWGGHREVDVYVGSGYYLHVENSVGADLSLLPVPPDQPAIVTNSTGDMNVPGQYQVGTQAWITDPFTIGTDVGGTWRFFMNGYVTSYEAAGHLYAKVYEHGTMTLLNPALTECPTDVANRYGYFEFEWNEGIPPTVINAGESLYVEIWLNASSGGGFSGVSNYNYSGIVEGVGPHYAYFCDTIDISEPAGPNLQSWAELTTPEYAQVTYSDDDRAISFDPGNFNEVFTWCSMGIAEPPSSIVQIDMTFEGQGDRPTDFQIWIMDNVNAWSMVGTAVSVSADTDISFTRSITVNCGDYISSDTLTWGCYQTDSSDLIRVDLLEVNITYDQPPPRFILGYDNDTTPSMIVIPEVGVGNQIFEVGVELGWNLISFPFNLTGDPVDVLDDSAGDGTTTWNLIQWYDASDTADPWKAWGTFWPGSLNDLLAVNNTMGLWIYITAVGDGFLTVSGAEDVSTSIALKAGWNLVGYPATDDSTYNVTQLKTTYPTVTGVEGYNSTAPYRLVGLPDTYLFNRGSGYWIYTTTDISWIVDW